MKRYDAARALVVLLACGAAAACDPDSVPETPNEAAVAVEVGPDATGSIVVAFGAEPDEATLATIADTIDGDVFTGRPATSAVVGNGGGSSLLEFTSRNVFEPGASPTVAFDTRRLCDDLMATGITDLDVRLSLPSVSYDSAIVPDQPASDRTWHVRSCVESPHGSVVIEPDPGKFWRELLLLVVVVVANVSLAVIGARGLRVPRWTTISLSTAAVASSLLVIGTAGATAGDNMEVAGRISHGANQVYFVVALVIALIGPIAAIAQPFYWRLPRDERPRLRRRRAAG